MSQPIPAVIAEHIRAVNAFDTDAILRTFSPDAIVNDNRREFVGIDAIRRWIDKEIVGDKVTMEIREVVERQDGTIVRARYDGLYDKTQLPAELILTNYFTLRDGRISTLIIVFNQPSPY
jgi:hypothetical protein